MLHKTIRPAPLAKAGRAMEVKALGRALDIRHLNQNHTESLAIRVVAARFRISVCHARVVCELAGIGGAI